MGSEIPSKPLVLPGEKTTFVSLCFHPDGDRVRGVGEIWTETDPLNPDTDADGAPDGTDADEATERLLRTVNDDGRIYLNQTTHDGLFVIRFQVGQFDCTREDVMLAVEVLEELAATIR